MLELCVTLTWRLFDGPFKTWLIATVSFSSVTNVTTVERPGGWLLLHLWFLYVEPSVFFAVVTKHGQAGENGGRSWRELCLLRWGMSRGWGASEVENTSAVEPPINLQSQLCLFRVNTSCARPGPAPKSAPLYHWQPWRSEMWHL